MTDEEHILVWYLDEVTIDYDHIDRCLNPEWVDFQTYLLKKTNIPDGLNIKDTAIPPYFESLSVSLINEPNYELYQQVIAICFEEVVEVEYLQTIATSVTRQLSPRLLLFNVTGNVRKLLQQIEIDNIGIPKYVFRVNGEVKIGGQGCSAFEQMAAITYDKIQEERKLEEERKQMVKRVLDNLLGKLIHTTSPKNFRAILSEGFLLRGMNPDYCGKCQAMGCLSLNDLRRSTEEDLLKSEANWWSQIISPSGCGENLTTSVTLIINREKLISSKLQYLQDRKDFLGPPFGLYIVESEVCYCDDIPIDAIDQIFLLDVESEPMHFLLCSLKDAAFTLTEFEARIQSARV